MKLSLATSAIIVLTVFVNGSAFVVGSALANTSALLSKSGSSLGIGMSINNSTKHVLSRATINDDCPLDRYAHIYIAMARCRDLALTGETGSNWGSDAKFRKYFKQWSSLARQIAAARFRTIRTACSEAASIIDITCTDWDNDCSDKLAYSKRDTGQVVICPRFWSLPVHAMQCRTRDHGQIIDQGMFILALVSQLPDVHHLPTFDYSRDYSILSPIHALSNSFSLPMYALGKRLLRVLSTTSFIDSATDVHLACD